MILIIGGAYQGKKEFVLENYHIKNDEVLDFENFEIKDLNNLLNIIKKYKVLYNLHIMIRNSIKLNIDYNEILDYLNHDQILIIDDISCGVVPLQKEDRNYRECVSKFMVKLSKKSDEVYRIFAGLPMKIK